MAARLNVDTLRWLDTLIRDGPVAGMSDGQLLERFLARPGAVGEAAFEALVRRHGPTVLAACRGVLRDDHDTDDAFQATFLVLARRAAHIRDRDRLATWLARVARRIALRHRAEAARRAALEQRTPFNDSKTTSAEVGLVALETASLVRGEVDRLPEADRLLLRLTYWQGRTYEEAAALLSRPIGTVRSRLSRIRERLRGSLARHGLAPSLVATGPVAPVDDASAMQPSEAAALGHGSAAARVPEPLVASTVRAATSAAAGRAVAGFVSATVAALAEAGARSLSLTRVRAVAAGLLAVVSLGGGWLAYGAFRAGQAGAGDEGRPRAASRRDGEAASDREVPQPGPPIEDVRPPHNARVAAGPPVRRDPGLLVHYTFENETGRDRVLRDLVGGPDSPRSGAIVGCSWVTGRSPEKRGLEFRRAGDRVRLRVAGAERGGNPPQGKPPPPGEGNSSSAPAALESISLVAWARVDALPNDNNALFMTDRWEVGGVHWQVGERGELILGVRSPEGVPNGHYDAPDVFGPERLGEWVQVAAVYDRDRRRVTHYVDGRPVARIPIRVDVPLRIEGAEIGNWHTTPSKSTDPVRHFVGRMDEFLLFARALDDREVGRLYAEGRPPP